MAQWDRAAGPSELDVVLTGALVIDPVLGIVKGDIGIKDGRIAGVGHAGNPDVQGRRRHGARTKHQHRHHPRGRA